MKHKKGGPGRAALLVALAGVVWSFAGVLGKFAPWNAFSLAGLRAFMAMIFFGLMRRDFRPVNTLPNWLGGVGAIATGVLFMLANKLTSAANAIVLQYAMTAVVIAVEALFFRVRPKKIDIAAACTVMIGVVLCFWQGLGKGSLLGDTLALLSAFTYSLVFLAARMPGIDVKGYVYQGNLLGCLLLLAMPFDPGVASGGVTGWLVAIAMGVCLTLGYLCFVRGMEMGISATVAAVVSNVEPVLNPTWVFLVLGENPGALTMVGALVVLGAVTAYSIINMRLARKRGPAQAQ